MKPENKTKINKQKLIIWLEKQLKEVKNNSKEFKEYNHSMESIETMKRLESIETMKRFRIIVENYKKLIKEIKETPQDKLLELKEVRRYFTVYSEYELKELGVINFDIKNDYDILKKDIIKNKDKTWDFSRLNNKQLRIWQSESLRYIEENPKIFEKYSREELYEDITYGVITEFLL